MYMSMAYLSIHRWKTKNMAAAESTGTSSGIQGKSEKNEKFGGIFLFSPQKGKIKAKEERDGRER